MEAGFAKVEISESAAGADLMGYVNRSGPALALHDPLFARAMVLEHDGAHVAMCIVDLCAISEETVQSVRERVAAQTAIRRDQVFIAATHTHSAPFDLDERCWPSGLHSLIAQAIIDAHRRAQPARIGAGWGFLLGHAINRRRFEDPVDPAVFVLRVDGTDGRPLGALYSFACHPVVLGPDSREISADWPATASRLIEQRLGGAVTIFAQGSCGDVNPLTASVLERLAREPGVGSGSGNRYYGPPPAGREGFDIGDRTGGTFAEAAVLGSALAEEATRVHRGVTTAEVVRLWTRQLAVAPGGNPAAEIGPLGTHLFPRAAPGDPLEIMLIGIDGPGVVLIGQPGEVFGETGVGLRRDLRSLGIAHPFVTGYANGWRAYLPPPSAYVDGGYEVDWAQAAGLSRTLQDRIRRAILDAVSEASGPVGTRR